MTQQQSLDRGSFKTYTDAKHGGKGKSGDNGPMNRSQALLARGQLSDGQRTLTSLSGVAPGQSHLIADFVGHDASRQPVNTSKLNDKFNQTQQQAVSKFNNFTQHEGLASEASLLKLAMGQKGGLSQKGGATSSL